MSPLPAAQFAEALAAFQYITAWWGGWIPVRLGSWHETEAMWRQGPASDLPELVRWLDEEHDEEVLLGLPQSRPWAGGVSRCSVLWCRVESPKALARAQRFKPRPSLVLTEGQGAQRLLVWALDRPAPWPEVREANRRLAYKFGAVQKHGDPDVLWVPAPGSCLRDGRARPVPVRVSRLTTATFRLEQFAVSRWLKAPPEPTWMTG